MTDRALATTDRVLVARFLRRAADYHEPRRTNVVLDGSTAATIAHALAIPGVDPTRPHSLTPRQARTHAEQLDPREAA